MGNEKPEDLTLRVLINIRDESKGLREDTNKRFERIEADISEMKKALNAIVVRFDRDYLVLALEMNGVKVDARTPSC